MNSLTYNNVDLSIYGLTVVGSKEALAFALGFDTLQLTDRSYAGRPIFPPKTLKLPIAIKASSSAQLTTYIDNIKRVCAQLEEKKLVLDAFSDRYWKARFNGISGERAGAIVFEGELDFTADDPLAYAVAQTNNDFNIDSDPKTVTESVGGTILYQTSLYFHCRRGPDRYYPQGREYPHRRGVAMGRKSIKRRVS